MQLRQAAALHHARYRGGFHSAASLAAAQAGMKFAVAHNIPAFGQTKKENNPISLHPAKLATGGLQGQGYINGQMCFIFQGLARP